MPMVLQCAQLYSCHVRLCPPRQPSYGGEEDDSYSNQLGPPMAVVIVVTSY
jgi:hypothetical protein